MIAFLLVLALAGAALASLLYRRRQSVPYAQGWPEEDWPMPADLVAEHMAFLEHGEPPEQWRPIRLRGPNERGPTRAQVKRFMARTQAKRAWTMNRVRLAVRRVAARRAPRQRRVRRATSVARARAPAPDEPPPPAEGPTRRSCAQFQLHRWHKKVGAVLHRVTP
jgi:hypothetical protein